ncbi:alpha-N-arabinofuranosidase [Bacteroidota bacterium]
MICINIFPQEKTLNSLIVNADQGKYKIDKHIYGHFAEHLGRCIYGGFWVGENSDIPNTRGIRNDVVKALKDIEIPNLRWPGGCFADTYHWKDGIGPRKDRPSIVNVHWGGVTEDNSFGTHEFMDLCEQLDCEAYICGNVGSGTVQEMAEWVEYLTSDAISPMTNLRKMNGREKPWRVKFWAIGNESWGCGGNMTADFYADLMRQYSTFCRDYSGNRMLKVACGPYDDNYKWTETLMNKQVNRNMMQGLALHYYTVFENWGNKGSATDFDTNRWYGTLKNSLKIDELITRHSSIMDKYDPDKKIGLMVDEWGNWFDVEPGTVQGFLYQQNSLRDAITAAITLNIFNNHADRVTLANIAQTVNVLQSMILTKDEKIVLTPSYYVFKMYKVFHETKLLPIDLECEDYMYKDKRIKSVSASASIDKNGVIHISLVNLNHQKPIEISCDIIGEKISQVSGEVLTAEKINDYNDFDMIEKVKPVAFADAKILDNKLMVILPAKSVVVLSIN